ncbi:hypothetical protein [Streptomyces sp. NPDC060001]|uniref:hypothetical protein n=1 Tax=Streptomyces sp. NPDC060001 TaxID=3347032 RepID=UPI0036AB55A6
MVLVTGGLAVSLVVVVSPEVFGFSRPTALRVAIAMVGVLWLLLVLWRWAGLRHPRGRTYAVPEPPSLTWSLPLLGLLVVALTWYGLRNVLDTYATRGELGPGDASDVLLALSGGTAVVTAASLAVSRIFRAWGAKNKDSGSGSESEAKGRAEVIMAEADAEARVTLARAEAEVLVIKAKAEAEDVTTRAKAELRTADAEYLRAEKGIEPLPAAGADNLPALGPAPSPNGNPGAPALPPGGNLPNPT